MLYALEHYTEVENRRPGFTLANSLLIKELVHKGLSSTPWILKL